MKQLTNKIITTTSFNPFKGPEIVCVIPITQPQHEIWISCELGGQDANRAYNESVSLFLKGDLNKTALEDAIHKLVERHEALRATFSKDGRFMTIFQEVLIEPYYQDISELSITEKKKSIEDYLSRDANHIFKLEKGPLLKIGLLKLSELEYQLVLTAHHIICDGWSIGIMLEELGSFYSANNQGITPDVPQPETFSSYAEEEERFIGSTEYKKTEQYWLKQYEASVPTVIIPTDFPRPKLRTFKSNRLDFGIDNDLVSDLKKVGIKSGASFVVTLLAAFEVFLYHQTGQDDLVLGLPAAGQSQSGKTQLIGHCVNLLPLRSKLAPDIPFNEYLKNRKKEIFDAYEHQQFSFGQLLQKLNVPRDISRVPLVPVVFNINMGMADNVVFNGLTYKLKSNPRAYEAFELFLNATGTEEELILEWSYNTSLFKPATIKQMMASFKEVLYAIVHNPSIEIGNIIKVDYSAYIDLNDTQISYPQFPLHELLARQSQITPLKQAIKFGDSEISYENLEKQANQLAHYLMVRGFGNGDFIAVSLPRSIELVVTLIAIMKCGAAYLPLDPSYPNARLEFMLDDSDAKCLITSKNLLSSLIANSETLFFEDVFLELSKHPNTPTNVKVGTDELAYLLYTSGSTGKPKGVPITHRNLVNFLCSMIEKPGIKESDKLLSITTISFDIAGLELFIPLLKGAKLVLTNEETVKDSRLLLDLMKVEAITIMQATPTTWQMLLDVGWEKSLPIKALCGGEALPLSLAKNILEKVDELWNMYGPTETTIWSAIKQISKADDLITIGRPIANTQIYIIDEQNCLVHPGKPGELCIAGDGVAKGYWKRQDLTDKKFIKNPFESDLGPVLYRTGDIAKLLPSGEVQCLGRIDQQVKIRGHRIELEEIESVINELQGIKQSIVVASNQLGSDTRLIAYIKAEEKFKDIKTIRSKLKEILPDILCPSNYMFLDDFPVTPNGKIDKKNLPSPEYVRPDSGTVLKIPQTKLEKDIAKVWGELLQIPVIDIEDNFFEMGGSSLIAQRAVVLLRKKLNTEIPLINIFQYPTVSQLAKFLSKNLKVEDKSEKSSNVLNAHVIASISNLNPQELHNNVVLKKKTALVINTTKAQSEILTDCFFGGDDAKRAYNISRSLKFAGKLKYDALELAIQSLVERHESLRSSFSEDLQLMHVYTDFQVDILYYDISNQGETEKQKSKKSLINDDVNYLFDLVNGPLLKFNLVKINELEHELMLTVNHAICDGLSMDILLEELGVLYSAFCQDKIPNLSEPDRFSLFADKENKFADSDEYKRSEEFWLNMYQESIPKLELPIDYPRPKLRTYSNHHFDFLLDNSLLNALKQIGNSAESNIFTSIVTTLVAAFEVFLYQQTGQNDLVLGLASSRRANYDMMQVVGHAVNVLPLRSKVDTKISFKDYLIQRNTQLFDAYENQSISFGHLLEKLSIHRDPSRVPLVPVIINIQLDDALESKYSFFDLSTEIKHNENNYRTFEIELQIFMSNEGPCFRWRYNTTLFKPETIEQMMASFEEVMNGIVANPKVKIGDIIKVDDSAYSKLNDTLVSYPQLPLHELFVKQAKITPLNQALKFQDSEVSYENLEKQIHQVAHFLKAQGVGNGDYVAVSLPRSIELVVTLIAIMECGSAYLPLDPNFPGKRLKFMLEDSEAKFLITTKEFSSLFNSNSKVLLSEDIFLNLAQFSPSPLNISVDINDIAYIMYTSGSTGKPKGVMVTHKNLVNFLCSMMHEPGIRETDKLLSITTISFDIAGLELFLPLLKGATLVIASDETAKDSRLMLELMLKESITILQATPSTWQMLLDFGWEKPLPIKALCGGEALPMGLSKKLLEKVNELWNLYGPTETTIWSSVKRILMEDDVITIGRPIANTQLYILNEQNHLATPNTIGEICIAGDGVSKGYWKRPDLTDEKFITNPFETKLNTILYRTGDLGKMLHTGEVQCLGRIDNQVKIRGHRIELGEIEQIVDALEGVKASVVIVKNDLLIANIISSQLDSLPETTVSKWKKSLTEILPAYMVPQQFNLLSEFPTNVNGKIDRKALNETILISYTKSAFAIAQTNSEKIIETIWKECLGIDKIDINSDFFELGGHSLMAVKVMSLIEKQTGNRLPLAALLEHPTIQKLAAYMDKKFISWDSLVPLKQKGSKPPLFIVHGANHNVLIYKNIAEYVDDEQPVYALQAKGLSGEVEPHKSVEEMASYYISEIKTIYPEGPYALGGFSFGGIVAFEMAKQLKAEGKKVKIVALFDSYVYPSYYYTNPYIKKVISTLYNISQLIFNAFNMFSSVKNFKRRKNLLKLKIFGLYLRIKYGREKQNQLQFNYSSKIDKMHALAFIRYNLTPQDIKVDLFRSTKDIYFAHDYKYLGWKKIAVGGIRKHIISGNHSEMFLSPAVEEVGSILQKVMDSDDSES